MKRIITTLLCFSFLIIGSNKLNAQCISAVELDGSNQYMYSPFNDYTFTNFTIEMWVNSATFSNNVHYVSLHKNAYIVLGDWGTGTFDTWADGLSPINFNSGVVGTINTWHHVAFVFDGVNQMIYLDGTLVMSTATTGAVNHSVGFSEGFVVGARHDQTQQFSTAKYDDVRVWTVARTEVELQANMNTNLLGTEAGLVAYYTFEDGVGSSTVTDLTGNGNTLTLNNLDPTTDWVEGNGINSVDTSVTTIGLDMMSNAAGATYQWLDCDNGNAEINGANGQTYTATANGNYAVEVTSGSGCIDTSACVAITIVGIEENTLFNHVSVYPNPNIGEFSISFENYTGEVNIEVVDVTGNLVSSSKENVKSNVSFKVDLRSSASGLYFVKVSGEYDTNTIRVIKK